MCWDIKYNGSLLSTLTQSIPSDFTKNFLLIRNSPYLEYFSCTGDAIHNILINMKYLWFYLNVTVQYFNACET